MHWLGVGGNGNPLSVFFPENPMDREDWWAAVHSGAGELDRLRLTLGMH